ncbi:MAG: bacillithiol biosynthesis deacetylase BshB1 [Vicinamibacteria bacterium]
MAVDVVAFGPHPDDVELLVGGTLLRLAALGYRTAIVDLTAGEMGTRGTREKRKAEADEAARHLGVTTRRCLDLGDGRVTPDLHSKMKVVMAIRELRPSLVFTNYWESNHPDHANAGPLVEEAAYLSGLSRIDVGGEPHRPNRVIYYFVPHRVPPSFIVDISDYYEKKLHAVQSYRSQFHDPTSSEPQTTLSHPDFFARIEGIHRYYGALIDATFGEAFYVREALKVDDPIAFFDKPYTRFV